MRSFGLFAALFCIAASSQEQVEWLHTYGDAGSNHYSLLEHINSSNVAGLEIVWSAVSPDAVIQAENAENPAIARATYYQCAPVMAGGVVYGSTCLGQAFALDAATGETRWVFNPESFKAGRPPNLGFISRGVAYWEDPAGKLPPRVYYAVGDSYLRALDAKTGRLVDTFGDGGAADLIKGVPRGRRGRVYGHPSPPVISGETIIVGASITDGPTVKEGIPGRVKAFDLRTGTEKWTFNLVPNDGEFGADTWEDDAWSYSGGANVWTSMSVDTERGLVYLPSSTPTNDFYGGHRRGDNLFAESLVCVDADTGRRVWHQQIVHHGLWDYDLPCAPNLIDVTVNGETIPAVAQATKHGFVFVFDRRTGEPVWPIEEVAVPQSRVPGEATSPTQPVPTWPEPFVPQGVSKDDLVDFTPELRARAEKVLEQYEWGPLFTPPAADKPTILMPGYGGGANWPGIGYDPETEILYIPAMHHPSVVMLGEPDPARSNFKYTRARAEMPEIDGLSIFKPPYASIVALDLKSGKVAWRVSNGGDGPRDHPLLKDLDLPPLGSNGRAAVLVTKSLVFATEGSGRSGSATGGGVHLRALDKATGEEYTRIELPGQATGVPVTYALDGRQYIVVAVDTSPAQLVALALPEN